MSIYGLRFRRGGPHVNDVRWWLVPPALDLDLIRYLNWRAYLAACVTGSPPFTPYHAASKARRTLRFSQEHKS
jgi:hypothetical protein